ncbi:IS110 family transposase [Acidianus manzaensis]|uniref:IS110 family transposase n=1 Tax=Acidianus manzaensis TaxID=282676 RepID=A0A1W6K343_9CREN|nr:IS110 family transposase [Acidianus manzaensis]ARM76953.1 IS110 family transposase [Acidianus manzaensis]
MEGQKAGIDVGKKNLYLSYQGKIYKLNNNEQGYEEIRKMLPRGTKIILEDSGIYTRKIIRALGKDFEIRIVNPLIISKHKSIRGKKSDKIDAKKLAEIKLDETRMGKISKERELTTQWDFITRTTSKIKNRIRRNLNSLGLDDKLNKDNLEKAMNMNEPEADEIKFLLQELKHFEERKKKIEEELKTVIPRDHVIFTIPGIGETIGSLIVARVGDFSRFSTKKKFVAYCGLDPFIEQSGSRILTQGISKRGDALLRKLFYLSALTAIRVNPTIKEFYENHKGKLKGKKLIIACARKLAVITWAVCYYNKAYSELQ